MYFKLKILHHYNALKKYQIEKKRSELYQVKFFNFWEQEITDMWFLRFIQSRRLLDKYPKITISFFSILGERFVFNWDKSKIKIFFSGENLQERFLSYSDHALSNNKIDLSIGFEHLSDPRYIHFPLWLLFIIDPESSDKKIIETVKELSYPIIGERPYFMSHISSWDGMGIRNEMCNTLTNIEKVTCAGKFMHNDDSLHIKYKDNKIAYLKNFKFNICPENTNTKEYVTEKLFHSIQAGCIPIYWGADNKPEPEILNKDAILFWEKGSKNEQLIETIIELNQSQKKMKDFMMQPRLTEEAPEKILTMINELEIKLKQIIQQKADY